MLGWAGKLGSLPEIEKAKLEPALREFGEKGQEIPLRDTEQMAKYRKIAFEILERNVAGSRTSLLVNGVLVLLILGSVLSVILESNKELSLSLIHISEPTRPY